MSVICIMILLLAVTRTEASPVLGNDHVNYEINRIYFPVKNTQICLYNIVQPCVLPAKEGSTVTCRIYLEVDKRSRYSHYCQKPRKDNVTFKRLSDKAMGMKGLDIPNEYTIIESEGTGEIDHKGRESWASAIILKPHEKWPGSRLIVDLTKIN
eukprot:Nk52_evm1s2284 gene=Nk52_evmTU1s2284